MHLFTQGTWDIFAPRLAIHGFEADPQACEEANQAVAKMNLPWKAIHYPFGLWSESGRKPFYITRVPNGSSLFRPSQDFIDRIEGSDWIRVDRTIEVPLETLDLAFPTLEEPFDFVQLDVQGGELEVLKGGVQTLAKGTLALQVEVEFRELYEGQPLFGDIDVFLRQQGFSFFGYSQFTYDRRAGIPIYSSLFPGAPTWGNAFYLRDLVRLDRNQSLQTAERLLTLACVADTLGFHDFALEVLTSLTLRFGQDEKYNFADLLVDFLLNEIHYPMQEIGSIPMIRRMESMLRRHRLPLAIQAAPYRTLYVNYKKD